MGQEFCSGCVDCEYDGGYIVVYQGDDCKEVWRRRIDVLGIPAEAWPSGPSNKPGENMMEGNRIAENRHLDADRSRDPDHLRGQFVPWARLAFPQESLASKFVQGTLLESNSQRAFLYDIEKAELQKTIEVGSHGFGNVRYVDINEKHIFLVRPFQLTVYDQATSSLVLSIPAGRLPCDFYANPEDQLIRTEEALNHGELGFRAAGPAGADREEYFHAGT
jgi:hypothetical protein